MIKSNIGSLATKLAPSPFSFLLIYLPAFCFMLFPKGLLGYLLVTDGGLFTQLGTWNVWVLNLYPNTFKAFV